MQYVYKSLEVDLEGKVMNWWIGASKFLALCSTASPTGDKFS